MQHVRFTHDAEIAKYVLQQRVPAIAFAWINDNLDILHELYTSLSESAASAGFPFTECVNFQVFVLLMSKLSHVGRYMREFPAFETRCLEDRGKDGKK